ncbi:Fe-S cluster assembly protein SufD [Xanthobacter dioxanivorans]|uniref:Fe-S cluster assembly protein SufD n=1 Tax=Xanthobacter dioxanivorans TaxID=2528964 RepID=A0A974PR28_9HYPH|nr:Fe-S cluster assembly protein SufD [Xanthobacter dioxanivorans]QRG07610.1 Fe-S cluster assembly protein SufD [Xanthobacter dioxanivorans]
MAAQTSAPIRPLKTSAELALAETFAAARTALPGGREVAAQRAAAFDTFADAGLPHRRVEAWRYTDLRALMRDAKPLATPPDAQAKAQAATAGAMLAGLGARRLVLVNGAFVPELSDLAALEPGLSIRAMAQALSDGDALVSAHLGKTVSSADAVLALNTALMGDGVVVHVARGAVIARPIELVCVTTEATPVATFTRSLVVVEDEASLTLIESHEGPAGVAYQVNTALELVVGAGASVERVKITTEGSDAVHLATLLARVDAHARFSNTFFTTGGAVVRNQLLLHLAGEAISAHMGGVSLLAGKQHADTLLSVDHAAPAGESRESFRAVLDGSSQDIFQGKIAVRQAAQKTDARMLSRALLLTETAEACNKPELEIFADDVQCGHGCTTGTLDQQLRFYLMSRGIPAKEAEALLIQAFVGEVVDAIGNEGVRTALTDATQAWLLGRE